MATQPSYTTISLQNNDYVTFTDDMFMTGESSLVIAGTGSGKTTAVTHKLTKQFNLVVFALPSTTKVQELENKKTELKSEHGVNSLYYYDKLQPDAEKLEKFKGLIVCTYDKFCGVHKSLSKEQRRTAIVVIDECHKMYATGSFRDEALLPMICTLRQNNYAHTLYTTATYTAERWAILELPINNIITYNKPSTKQRDLQVVSLSKGDQYSYIELITDRVQKLKQKQKEGKILVRINNKRQCEMLANFLHDNYKLNCLVVHGGNKNEEAVQAIFKRESIPTAVDVIISTSIFDEGINLNNADGTIDSIFVIGKSAHIEELVQYQGRLRKANAPCFLVLHTQMDTIALDKKALNQFHAESQAAIDTILSKVKKVADLICSVDQDLMQFVSQTSAISTDEDDIDDDDVMDNPYEIDAKLNKLNTTFYDWCEAKLFGMYGNRILPNYPSLAALGYRLDKAKCYENFEYFKYRLLQLSPNTTVSFVEDKVTTTSEATKSYFDEQAIINEKALSESLEDAFDIFLKSDIPHEFQDWDNDNDLFNRALYFQKAKQADGDFIKDLVVKNKVAHTNACVQNIEQIALLGTQIGNLHHIQQIIKRNDFTKVMAISKAYKQNDIMTFLMPHFKKYHQKTINDNGLKITGVDAEKYLVRAFRYLSEHMNLPIQSIISKRLIKNVKYNQQTKEISIKPSKALNFIKSYFDVKEVNAHKKNRYLIMQSLKYKDYHFIAIDELLPFDTTTLEPFTVGDTEYSSTKGKRILSAAWDNVEDIFEDDLVEETHTIPANVQPVSNKRKISKIDSVTESDDVIEANIDSPVLLPNHSLSNDITLQDISSSPVIDDDIATKEDIVTDNKFDSNGNE